jgi:hypothetical protein
MNRTMTLVLGAALLGGCKGGEDGEGTGEAEEPLPTVAGSFDAGWDLVEDSCGGNIADDIGRATIKLDQVSTGLSVFIDPDIGWIPCEGSVRSFDCRWGNGPSDSPDEVWSWSLIGAAEDGWLEATLRLEITCGGGGQCEECTVVGTFSGELQN